MFSWDNITRDRRPTVVGITQPHGATTRHDDHIQCIQQRLLWLNGATRLHYRVQRHSFYPHKSTRREGVGDWLLHCYDVDDADDDDSMFIGFDPQTESLVMDGCLIIVCQRRSELESFIANGNSELFSKSHCDSGEYPIRYTFLSLSKHSLSSIQLNLNAHTQMAHRIQFCFIETENKHRLLSCADNEPERFPRICHVIIIFYFNLEILYGSSGELGSM